MSDAGGTQSSSPRSFRLVVLSGGGQVFGPGDELVYRRDLLRIGRGEASDLTLKDQSVSRTHAEIRRRESGFVIVDCDSANGVWVSGHRVREHELASGDVFRLGGFEIQFFLGERSTADQGRPVGALELLAGSGEVVAATANAPFLLSDKNAVWLVEAGKVEIFAVGVAENRPVGARSHFVTVPTGGLIFGMDLEAFEMGCGFLGVGGLGTRLRRMPLSALKRIAADELYSEDVAAMVDAWVVGLCQSLTRDIPRAPVLDQLLEIDQDYTLGNRRLAGSIRGVVWLELRRGNLLFIGLENLAHEGSPAAAMTDTHSTVLRLRDFFDLARAEEDAGRALFPLTPETWVEAANPPGEASVVHSVRTRSAVADGRVWPGLDAFHRVLCQCEFVNKKLETFDEYARLRSKSENAEAAARDAYHEISRVLSGAREASAAMDVDDDGDAVVAACALVARDLGIEVQTPAIKERAKDYGERLGEVARASRFRLRKVALRDDWWLRDHGPMLARLEESDAPVALLPKGSRSYLCVDPATGRSTPVDQALARRLHPFAHVFYRPFPEGPVKLGKLLRFASHRLAKDLHVLLAMGVALGLLGTLSPHFAGRVFDVAIPEADRGLLVQYALALFIAALVATAFRLTQNIAVLRLQGRLDYGLQAAVWDRLLLLPAGFFKRFTAGDLADRAAGIGTIRETIAGVGVRSILGTLSGLFYVVLMFLYHVRLALVAVALAVTLVVVTTSANLIQLRVQRQMLALQGRISGLVLQLVAGIAKIRISGAENHAFRIWAKEFAGQRRLDLHLGAIRNLLGVFGAGFSLFSSMVIFFALVKFNDATLLGGADAAMSTGRFIAFSAAFGAFQSALQALSEASLSMLAAVPVYERLKPILREETEVDSTRRTPGTLRGAIEIAHLSFRYSEETPLILDDFSLEIRPGEFVAVVGESGCGKSTLIRLLLGFELPEKGSIYYDRQDLATLDLKELRRQVGVVLQTSTLLPADIYSNIVGTSSLGLDDAWDAADQAGIAEEIREMPMNMFTYLSEGGGGLSGGQKQRLLIARALVRKPRILIFDEATSALDNRSQAIVTESMERLQATRILIAHRLSTIRNADRICYLKDGRIAEMGSFPELMRRQGLFFELARRQMA